MTAAAVRMIVRKYDGSLHWNYAATRLGTDDHGVWLGVPTGTVYSKGAAGPVYTTAEPRVVLVPHDAWWTALFQAAPASLDAYCDVTTPPRWVSAGQVTTVDLDLDVCRERDTGAVFVDDQDEFVRHRTWYGYPPTVRAQAIEATTWLLTTLASGAEPFAERPAHWLGRIG